MDSLDVVFSKEGLLGKLRKDNFYDEQSWKSFKPKVETEVGKLINKIIHFSQEPNEKDIWKGVLPMLKKEAIMRALEDDVVKVKYNANKTKTCVYSVPIRVLRLCKNVNEDYNKPATMKKTVAELDKFYTAVLKEFGSTLEYLSLDWTKDGKWWPNQNKDEDYGWAGLHIHLKKKK